MLAAQLINAPFERLSQPEIVPMQRQDFAAEDRIEDPVRQVDRNLRHALGFGAANYAPAVNQPEPFLDGLAVGLQVGLDARAREAVERVLKLLVPAAVRVAIRRNQQIVG